MAAQEMAWCAEHGGTTAAGCSAASIPGSSSSPMVAERGLPRRRGRQPPHRETLEAAPTGIVSGLDLGNLKSSSAGTSPSPGPASSLSSSEGLASPLNASDRVEEEEGSSCLRSIVLRGDEFWGRGQAVELPCRQTLGSYHGFRLV